ncbi:MAG: hypothetical protein HRT99_03150 [Mycoplasmatales bacterium]|nr:hypothetical protein [Mycoplasmatales bacterium]
MKNILVISSVVFFLPTLVMISCSNQEIKNKDVNKKDRYKSVHKISEYPKKKPYNLLKKYAKKFIEKMGDEYFVNNPNLMGKNGFLAHFTLDGSYIGYIFNGKTYTLDFYELYDFANKEFIKKNVPWYDSLSELKKEKVDKLNPFHYIKGGEKLKNIEF